VLGISGVDHHLFYCVGISTPHHNQSHAVSSSLADIGRVHILVHGVLKLLVDVLILGSHSHQTKPQTEAVSYRLLSIAIASVLELLGQEVGSLFSELVSMDQTIGVVSSSLRVGRSGLAIRADSSEVRSKHFHSSFFVASVDESQRRSSAKSVPVC